MALAIVFIKQDQAKSNELIAKGIDKDQQIKIGGKAPRLLLKDLEGRTVDLKVLQGKVVVVDFWATWCPPCNVMTPSLVDIHERYSARGVEIVSVAMDVEGLDAVKPYAKDHHINYIVLLGDDDTAQQWGGVQSLPVSFFVDRTGYLRKVHLGIASRDDIEKEIRRLL